MNQQKQRVFNKIIDKIKSAKNIALISHRNPDGDTIGSATAFYEIIISNFPGKKINLVCRDKIPRNLSFINNSKLYKSYFDPEDYDLIIFFDSGSKSQTSFDIIYPELFDSKTYNTIGIDHHKTNEVYCRQNLIMTNYASTTMIIYELFKDTSYYINQNAATSLLTGIFTDTGGLKHSNTNFLVYKYVRELIKLGADRQFIIDNFFKNNSLDRLRLWGRIIEKSFIDKDNILFTYINKTDIDAFGADYEDISGITDLLNSREGIKYSAILTQKGEYVKGSLRTLRDDIDLTSLAKKHGGGGHKKASGFTTTGSIEEIKTLNF
ncbi:MAG: DHH family phosphoesterase [Candidatus Gracilibacteria bacterium]|nr:DHH family phosphoesterase [Candidatus Gracilibacteria bacterium]